MNNKPKHLSLNQLADWLSPEVMDALQAAVEIAEGRVPEDDLASGYFTGDDSEVSLDDLRTVLGSAVV